MTRALVVLRTIKPRQLFGGAGNSAVIGFRVDTPALQSLLVISAHVRRSCVGAACAWPASRELTVPRTVMLKIWTWNQPAPACGSLVNQISTQRPRRERRTPVVVTLRSQAGVRGRAARYPASLGREAPRSHDWRLPRWPHRRRRLYAVLAN